MRTFAVALAVSLAACGNPPAPAAPAAASAVASATPAAGKTVRIGEGDAGKTVEARVGDALELTLPTNPSTGYDWQVDQADPSLGEPKITRPEGPAKGVGAATTMTFAWSPKSPGDHEVKLAYRRPWEKDDPPEKTFSFKLRVAK